MISLYITGLIVGLGLGIMISALGLLIYIEYFSETGGQDNE
tara:strand:- start:172 stop:294 length:123 start_codon:yes stop_codon:yes gene_type:complete